MKNYGNEDDRVPIKPAVPLSGYSSYAHFIPIVWSFQDLEVADMRMKNDWKEKCYKKG